MENKLFEVSFEAADRIECGDQQITVVGIVDRNVDIFQILALAHNFLKIHMETYAYTITHEVYSFVVNDVEDEEVQVEILDDDGNVVKECTIDRQFTFFVGEPTLDY